MSKQGRDQNRTERAAAVRAEQARKERNRRVALIAGIVVLLGAIVAGGAWFGSGGGSDSTSSASGSSKVQAGEVSLLLGSSSAPVKVVVYEDFQCPICRELENSTRTFLRENADKGKVYVEYQPINLLQQYPYSGKALSAFASVLQDSSASVALKFHDLLFDNQPYEQQSGSVTDSQIAGWAKDAGADGSKVSDAIKNPDPAFLSTTEQLMTKAGIQGTPTVFINGKELPAADVPSMVKTIETAVTQAG